MSYIEIDHEDHLKSQGYSKEDEYFHRKDREFIAKLRGKAQKWTKGEGRGNRAKAYWMRCPQCGSSLKEEKYGESVQLDRCTSCSGSLSRSWRTGHFAESKTSSASTDLWPILMTAFRASNSAVLKIIVVLTLSVQTLSSCVSHEDKRHSASQPKSSGVKPDVSQDTDQLVGQTLYVPIYSHIYTRDKQRTITLAATLSIRNTDAQNAIRVTAARYYASNGELLTEYVPKPLRVAPMASLDFVVEHDDTTGGVGANFIVEWSASIDVTPPVVEAVMINTASQQGISFVSVGRVLRDRSAATSTRRSQ